MENLSNLKFEPHVSEALNRAWLLSDGGPINAAHCLQAALKVNKVPEDSAFLELKKILNLTRLEFTKFKQVGNIDLSKVSFDSGMTTSFSKVKSILTKGIVWGRDYITLALLAIEDPSLREFIEQNGRILEDVQDQWYKYVTTNRKHHTLKIWNEWWNKAGVPTPNERRRDKDSEQIKYYLTQDISIKSEVEKIFLNATKLAKVFAEIVVQSTKQQPSKNSQEDRFYGIFGQWGRGKTHFWRLIKDYLHINHRGKYISVEFQAWKYQDTPAVWAYLYETLADKYYKKTTKWYYWPLTELWNIFLSFRLSFYRKPHQVLLFVAGLIGLILFYNKIVPGFIFESIFSLIAWAFTLIGGYNIFTKPIFAKAKDFIKAQGKRFDFRIHLGVQHEIQVEFRHLLKAWIPRSSKKVVLFVDDIDRCTETKIVQIIDSIRVMVNDPVIQKRLIVIAAIDERILGEAIRNKYSKFVESEFLDPNRLSAEYFDKLFITGIRLDELQNYQKEEILEGITKDITFYDTEVLDNENKQSKLSEIKDKAQAQKETIEINGKDSKELNKTPISKHIFQEEKIDSQLLSDEQKFLKEYVKILDLATPRSIRSYTIKYRLARNIVNIQLKRDSEPFLAWNKDLKVKKELARCLVNKMNFSKESKDLDSGHPEQLNTVIRQAVEMVSYYPSDSTSTPSQK